MCLWKFSVNNVIREKRVVFDFEIDFLNGGGIQGQGFRLDIDGDDIENKILADCIVQDMRLLMVGEVRILNKRIISEKHKGNHSHAIEPEQEGIEEHGIAIFRDTQGLGHF